MLSTYAWTTAHHQLRALLRPGERFKAESLVSSGSSGCWSPHPTQQFYSFVIFKDSSNPTHSMVL